MMMHWVSGLNQFFGKYSSAQEALPKCFMCGYDAAKFIVWKWLLFIIFPKLNWHRLVVWVRVGILRIATYHWKRPQYYMNRSKTKRHHYVWWFYFGPNGNNESKLAIHLIKFIDLFVLHLVRIDCGNAQLLRILHNE